MISLEGVQRKYPTRHGSITVLRDVNFKIQPGEKVGIVGRNGAGKSTMIRLISGAEKPNAGRVTRSMSVSWPLAFGGGFQGTLTGLDNLRFICRIYGDDWRKHVDYVQDFTELGRFLNEPLNSYSSGMRSRLAFALSMVIDFDCFLIDEIMAVGDHRFHERCHIELFEKRAHHAMVFVSHDAGFVRQMCSRASVLEDGYLHNFDELDEAFAFYYRPPAALIAPNLLLEAPLENEKLDLATLLFGADHAVESGLRDGVGIRFAEWLLGHPLTSNAAVARHRLDKVLTKEEYQLFSTALGGQLQDDFAGRSLHSAMAALAESRKTCPVSQGFLMAFEASLPMEGDDGLWHRMSFEGGSIRKAASFLHAATGRELPVRLDFHRPATENHILNELAEFTMHPDGVTCRLQLCMTQNYAPRMYATYPYLLPYFAESSLSGQFGLSLGDEGLPERVLSFCSVIPNFLLPDPLFIATGGYNAERGPFGEAPPWQDRQKLAYWRGTDTGAFRYKDLPEAPRVIVTTLSRSHPHLIDAKLTQVELRQGWEWKKQYYEDNDLMGNADPQSKILDYQYQIDIDGNTNSWSGLFLKLLTGAPVLKLASDLGFSQWFYDRLVPWVNFVPINANADDLIDKLEWLHRNPAEAMKIGQAGRELALSISYDNALAEAKETIARIVALNDRVYYKTL